MVSAGNHLDGAVRRNFLLNVLDGALFALGISMVSRSTVLPILVKRIGGGNIAVSLIPVLWFVGHNLPQLLIARRAEREPRKKALLLRTALAQRLSWLVLALLTFFAVEHVSPAIGLILFFTAFLLAAVASAINMPVWFDMVSRLTPVRLRGRLFALRIILGALLGVLGGWVVEVVLRTFEYPDGFAVLMGAAFAVMMISYVFLALLRETDAVDTQRQINVDNLFNRIPDILRKEVNFRNFLIAEVMIVVATVAEAFFVVDAIEQFSLPEAFAGRFVIVMAATMVFGSFVFGYVADRYGHRINLIAAAGCMAVACASALTADSVELYYVAFAGLALSLGIQNISRLTIVAELCGERERPTYVALTNLVTTPFLMLGLLAGWGADAFGYDAVFLVAGCLSLCAGLWLLAAVRDPRHHSAQTIPTRQ
ncbi:MAG: MFS transporter [Rhodothermia bacterium]|nr:MFS transporter [Rhodothermia bacterium]